MEGITERVCALAAQQLGVDRRNLSAATDLDSLERGAEEDFEWWIRCIEIECGIDIPYLEQQSLDTLGDLISCVKERVTWRSPPQSHLHPVAV